MNSGSIKKNFTYNILYQIIILIIPLITTPYISRVIGTTLGDYVFDYNIATYFVLFAMLGLSNYGNRTIAANQDNREKVSINFWNIYAMQLMTSGVMIFLFVIFIVLFRQEHMAWIMIIYVLSSMFDISWFYFGVEQFKFTVLRNAIVRVLSVLLIFLFVKTADDIFTYAYIMVGSALLSQLSLWPFLHRYADYVKPKWRLVLSHFKPNLILFIPVLAISLYKTMDKIMIGILAGNADVSYYEYTERIVLIPNTFVQALGTVMLPRMSYLVANDKKDLSEKYLYFSLLFALFLATSTCFGIMGVCKDFIPLYYGSGFDACIGIFLFLSPSVLFMACANVVRTQFLIPNKMEKIYISSVIVGAITNVIANSLLIPLYKGTGAAIGTLLAEAVVCLYQLVWCWKALKPQKALLRAIPLIVSGIIMFIILWYLRIPIENGWVALIFKIVIGAGLYLSIAALIYFVRKYFFKKGSIFQYF